MKVTFSNFRFKFSPILSACWMPVWVISQSVQEPTIPLVW